MKSSIRHRLTVWLIPALLATCAVFAVPTWLNVHDEIDELFDQILREAAYSLSNSSYSPKVEPAQNRRAPHRENIDLISQIRDLDGRILYRSHSFSPLPQGNKSGYDTLVWRGENWRVFNLKTDTGSIQIAQALRERRETANEITWHLLAPLLILLPGLALVVRWGIGQGLRPLQEVATAVERRNPNSLEPIPPQDLPEEVRILVCALNSLLERLDQALVTQRQFTADAAHELRSPLTALSLQAQLAERAGKPAQRSAALHSLRQGIDRASHLVQQLLTLARLDPEAGGDPHGPVYLDALARSVVADLAPIAASRNVDLGITRAEPILVNGSAESLRILLRNLIDNAINHSPFAARVDVSVIAASGAVRLEVVDTGPGIPAAERDRVFDRFYRGLDSPAAGSGLGLAIVKRIADRHRAGITLAAGDNGLGLKITIHFPEIPA
ncbi:ATP-binding protein [Methylomonas sp. 2BW1-5-20]|uniref:ATP-binding protein n=1 Tax=Methylomonas sp. 2BW1-5-20 TaxID=3376686 RepID=UPI00405319EA